MAGMSRLKVLAGSLLAGVRRRSPRQDQSALPRYANLLRLVRQHRCRRILEIGTHDGSNAELLILAAQESHPCNSVEYFGFDLFEEMSERKRVDEFALVPPAEAVVMERLRQTGAQIKLYRGDSRVTLPAAAHEIGVVDIVFIDGGHSPKTTRSDWAYAQRHISPATVVVFDDYFENEDPAVRDLGCRGLVSALDPADWQVRLLEPLDAFEHPWGTLRTRMVEVRRR